MESTEAGNTGAQNNSSEGEFVPSEGEPIRLTDSAVDAVRNILTEEGEDGDFLRVSVVGGGCSGFQYDLNFDQDERMDDTVLEYGDIRVVVDSVSVGYLNGTVIDYISGLNGTGFKFVNPNVKRTCGCGNSFG